MGILCHPRRFPSTVLVGLLASGFCAAEDTVRCLDGTVQKGTIVELGGNAVELQIGPSAKRILKREIEKVDLDASRPATSLETSDAVIKKSGHMVRGTVETLDGGQKVQVTLPTGGRVTFLRQDVARIIRKGDAITQSASVFTADLSAAITEAISKLSRSADPEAERFLAKCGLLALDRVRDARNGLPAGSATASSFDRILRLHRLKEVMATEIEESEPKVYEVLSSGSVEEKCSLLMFVFPRYVEESAPLAELLASDSVEDATVRAWSVDFLRRMQRNRELVRIYKRSTGQIQLATAIALGQNRILIGMPTLIEALELESVEIRALAAKSLRESTGQDIGFLPQGAPQARRDSIAQWRAWWQRSEAQINKVAEGLLRTGTADVASTESASTPERLDAVKLWTQAGAAVEAKHFPEAEAMLRRALDKDSTFFQAYIALAVVLYSHRSKPEEAVRVLDDLKTKRLPGVSAQDRQWIFVHLGNAKQLLKDWGGAQTAYTEAKSIAPENLHALLGLVDAAYHVATGSGELTAEERKESLHAALDSAKRATEVIDKVSEDLVAMSVDNVALAGEIPFDRREYNRSVLGLRKHYRQDKKELAYKMAKLLALTAQTKEAVLTLRSAIDDKLLDPSDESKKLEANIRCYLGLLYEELNQPLAALTEYRKVLKDLIPNHAECERGIERLKRHGADRASN